MKKNVRKIGYEQLPSTPSTRMLPGKLYLDDNFCFKNIKKLKDLGDGWTEVGIPEPFMMNLPYILFCRRGSISLTINGEEVRAGEGDVLVGFPGFIITGIRTDMEAKAGIIAFSGDDFLLNLPQEITSVIHSAVLSPRTFNLDERKTSIIVNIYDSIRRILESDSFIFKEQAVNGIMTLLFSVLAQWLVNKDENLGNEKSRNENLFLNFMAEVKVNCSSERKVSAYAQKFHMSPKYFAKLIYTTSGRHAGEWIRDEVIREAQAMLKSGVFTVQQVGNALNFPTPSFFGKYFKAATGLSPRKYQLANS